MSPPMRDNRRQKGKSSHNVSSSKDQKCSEDDLDTFSGTTSSTPRGSWAASDDDRRSSVGNSEGKKQGKQLLGMLSTGEQKTPPPPPPPPNAPPRTKLTSSASLFVPKTALATQATPFVPQGTAPTAPVATMPSIPSEGKECLMGVIQCTLGSELWDLQMVDCQSFTGEMYTSIDITIPALSASLCHVAASQDAEAIAQAEQATRSQATQSLLQNFQTLSPKVTIMPNEDTSRLSVQYCAADKDMLCWEFANLGHCPRWSTCRWAHACVETFLINLILQPLTQWCGGAPAQSPANAPQAAVPPTVASEPRTERWMPMRPPMPANDGNRSSSTVAALPLTNMNNQSPEKASALLDDPDDTPWPDHMKEPTFEMKKPEAEKPQQIKTSPKEQSPTSSRRMMPSRKNWADIQEDSDGDEPFQWSEG